LREVWIPNKDREFEKGNQKEKELIKTYF